MRKSAGISVAVLGLSAPGCTLAPGPSKGAALIATMGAGDVYLGEIGGCPFYIGKAQYEYWKHTQLIIDVIEGHGGTFSLEGPEGKAFHTRSRVFTTEEIIELEESVR